MLIDSISSVSVTNTKTNNLIADQPAILEEDVGKQPCGMNRVFKRTLNRVRSNIQFFHSKRGRIIYQIFKFLYSDDFEAEEQPPDKIGTLSPRSNIKFFHSFDVVK